MWLYGGGGGENALFLADYSNCVGDILCVVADCCEKDNVHVGGVVVALVCVEGRGALACALLRHKVRTSSLIAGTKSKSENS